MSRALDRLHMHHQHAGMLTCRETRDTVPLCMSCLPYTLSCYLSSQIAEDIDMAHATSIPNSDGMLLWSATRPREPPLTAMIAVYLLQVTCVPSQQETTSTRRATAPSADVRILHITRSRPQCYIGCPGEKDEPAPDNAYFASEALEDQHALITLNDKVHHTLDFLFVEVLT
jgi:hypothetical protein